MYLLLLIITFVVFIVMLYKLIVIYSEKVITVLIEQKHKDVEAILSTGIVPTRWAKRGINSVMVEHRRKSNAIRRLGQLIKYLKHSPLVESDDARQMLLERLHGIQEDWHGMEWKEMYPYK